MMQSNLNKLNFFEFSSGNEINCHAFDFCFTIQRMR